MVTCMVLRRVHLFLFVLLSIPNFSWIMKVHFGDLPCRVSIGNGYEYCRLSNLWTHAHKMCQTKYFHGAPNSTTVTQLTKQGQVDESFLSCPSFGCRMPFPRRVLDEMLGSDTSSKLMRMREILSVNRDRRRCWCPNATCGAAVQLLPPRPPPASTKRNCSSWLSGGRVWWQRRLLFSSLPLSEKKVRCGECMETFCYRCGGQPHRGSCVREPAYQEWAERVGEDSDGVQECPRCHHHIEKRGKHSVGWLGGRFRLLVCTV